MLPQRRATMLCETVLGKVSNSSETRRCADLFHFRSHHTDVSDSDDCWCGRPACCALHVHVAQRALDLTKL